MKFPLGSKIDEEWCDAMTDEAEQCIRAFAYFEVVGKMQATGPVVARTLHSAYQDFIIHLYEFYLAAFVRQNHDTNWTKRYVTKKHRKSYVLDGAFAAEGKRQVQRRLIGIRTRNAPLWENSASVYEEMLNLFLVDGSFSRQFGTDLRKARNNLHVSTQRQSTNLGLFFKKYHGVLWLMYSDVIAWKGSNTSTIGSTSTFF